MAVDANNSGRLAWLNNVPALPTDLLFPRDSVLNTSAARNAVMEALAGTFNSLLTPTAALALPVTKVSEVAGPASTTVLGGTDTPKNEPTAPALPEAQAPVSGPVVQSTPVVKTGGGSSFPTFTARPLPELPQQRFDFQGMLQALGGLPAGARPRTMGMNADQVHREYAASGQVMDKQIQHYLNAAMGTNEQERQKFQDQVALRQLQVADDQFAVQTALQRAQLGLAQARDARDAKMDEARIKLLEQQAKQVDANMNKLNAQALHLRAKSEMNMVREKNLPADARRERAAVLAMPELALPQEVKDALAVDPDFALAMAGVAQKSKAMRQIPETYNPIVLKAAQDYVQVKMRQIQEDAAKLGADIGAVPTSLTHVGDPTEAQSLEDFTRRLLGND